MAGLLDAHELTGSAQALAIATAMGEWVHQRLSRLEPERRQRMWSLYIAGEFGGMNETLARLSTAAQAPRLLETASFFDTEHLLEAGETRTDVLTDMHANQHLPQLVGYVEQYERTGERRYLEASIGIWDQIVPGRVYAHGGTGESELWGPPETVAGDVGHRNAETCASHNLLKLARKLFAHTLDARYMDYYERTVLNHVLGSRRAVRSDTSPEVTYMFPVHPGAVREYDNVGTCCGGTGLENHVKYQDTVYFQDAQGLYVNLPIDSELDWAEAGLRVRLESGFPLGGEIALRFEALDSAAPDLAERTVRVRVPSWVAGPIELRVNGAPAGIEPVPGRYAAVRRVWRPGDELRLDTPATLRAEAALDDPRQCALMLGPTVLLARSASTTALAFPLAGRRAFDGGLIHERTGAELLARLASDGTVRIGAGGQDTVEFEPCWSGRDGGYHMYVRSQDAEIAFGGNGTGVANRIRPDGGTFLDELWAAGPFADREAFLERVVSVAGRVRSEGLLGREELAAVLRGAAAFDGATGRPLDTEDGAVPAPLEDPGRVPPAVAIEILEDPAPSGWFTTAPRVRLRGFDVDDPEADSGDRLRLELRVSGGDWAAYSEPVRITDEGVHLIEARVTDRQGLTGVTSREISVDTNPPVSRATVKDLGASVEITLHAEDGVSGVERIQWEGPGTFWGTFQEAFVRAVGEEPQVIEFAATDRAGNEEPRRRLVIPGGGASR
jgi:hypothetical protein